MSGAKEELGLGSSRRDPEELRRQLEGWLQPVLPGAVVRGVAVPERTGISSLSVVLDVSTGAGAGERLVVRIAPEAAAVPVFPRYEFAKQFAVMQLVSTRSRAPVPQPLWYEPDSSVLGSEFIVMAYADGLVPPDVMPYTFGSWLSEASPEEQRRLQDASVDALAQVHETPLDAGASGLLSGPSAGGASGAPTGAGVSGSPSAGGRSASPLRLHVDGLREYYRWCTAEGPRVPVLEAGFQWLDESWPADEGEPVLSWGDARIGNIVFRDFRPVALLDWEMVGLGPRELDLGWMIYLHRWFDDIAANVGLQPMRSFMRVDEVLARYSAASGVTVAPLRWYLFYAALRHGVIMSRVMSRQIVFGEAVVPADPDELVLHHQTIRQMIDGSYWRGFDS